MCRWWAVLGCWLWVNIAWAQYDPDAYEAGHSGPPATLSPQRQSIQLLSGHIVVQGQKRLQSLRVFARYRYRNITNQTLQLQMLAPLNLHTPGLAANTPPHHPRKFHTPLLHRFRVKIQQKTTPITFLKLPKQYLPTIHRFYPRRKLGAYRWTITFPPNAIREVEIHYHTGVSTDSSLLQWFRYFLPTSTLWRGGRPFSMKLTFQPNEPIFIPPSCYARLRHHSIRFEGQRRQVKISLTLRQLQKQLHFCFLSKRNHFQTRQLHLTTTSELRRLTLSQLHRLRTTIEAKHGRIFPSNKVQRYFQQRWWYTPNPKFASSLLHPKEAALLKRIQQIEQEKQGAPRAKPPPPM